MFYSYYFLLVHFTDPTDLLFLLIWIHVLVHFFKNFINITPVFINDEIINNNYNYERHINYYTDKQKSFC